MVQQDVHAQTGAPECDQFNLACTPTLARGSAKWRRGVIRQASRKYRCQLALAFGSIPVVRVIDGMCAGSASKRWINSTRRVAA